MTGTMTISDKVHEQMADIVGRYPRSRSAIMPLLHLVQAEEGYVSTEGIRLVAERLGIAEAEVTAVASFYTMYLRAEGGDFRLGVCTNSLCAVLGGDEIWDALVDYVGVGNHETSDDGRISLDRIECQAACTHAPVMTCNWEFLDRQSPQSARDLVDTIRSGQPVASSRGPRTVRDFRAQERSLAGFDDALSDDDNGLDDLMLAGLRVARERGHEAPSPGSPAAPPEGK